MNLTPIKGGASKDLSPAAQTLIFKVGFLGMELLAWCWNLLQSGNDKGDLEEALLKSVIPEAASALGYRREVLEHVADLLVHAGGFQPLTHEVTATGEYCLQLSEVGFEAARWWATEKAMAELVKTRKLDCKFREEDGVLVFWLTKPKGTT